MPRLFSYCLLVTLLASTLVYAGNGRECPFHHLSNLCNKVENSSCKSKTPKVPGGQKVKDTTKRQQPEEQKIPSADTFEKFIAPFIETVAPHFYDKIIKKEERKDLNQHNKLVRNC
ncbi:hypothetical protein [Desertivirga brevis]|uniref:hypothetical protein n=1 Tax=Desertivirga brevis TaxID=2810310 RepID=UPI001A96DAD7|nr:hypothetical protein [Pedobacter sp. SYSU D00873]